LLNATRQVVLDVQSSFIDVLLAKENLSLAEANAKAWSAIVEVNAARVKAGDLAQVELLRTRLAALQSQNLVRQAQLRLHIASGRLQLLLGRTTAPLDVAGPLRRDTQPIQLDEVRELALKLRPDLEAQRRDQFRAQAEIDLQLANARIDYTVGTEFHRQYDNGKGNSMGFFFSVPVPLFNRNQGEIERARQERRQVEARARALEATIRNEVDNAYQQYATARDLLELDAKPCESILLVEFFEEAAHKLALLAKRRLGLRQRILTTSGEADLVWGLRKAGLSLLTSCKGAAKPACFIEDAAVRPRDLPAYVRGLRPAM